MGRAEISSRSSVLYLNIGVPFFVLLKWLCYTTFCFVLECKNE
ncbi:hypothetical protein MHA_0551 [Mannheimia haemolytica PHL213]|nr:hypothetical protein MHA_0551 [Mannheimia haemolytica PHL213]